MFGISYWILPIISSVVWLACLLGLFLTWIVDGRPHYPSMHEGQHVAYISDVGAEKLKPMFITMSAVTVVTLDIAFITERWLRHTGRLHSNTSTSQKVLSICATVAAIVGSAGLILLSIFDTRRHHHMHDWFLGVFIGGFIVSAAFICAEYQRLGIHYRQHVILRASFWIKLFFILMGIALAIAFGVCNKTNRYNAAAIIEWIVALVYTFYVASFFLDFIPAVHSKHDRFNQPAMAYAEDSANVEGERAGRNRPAGRYYGDGYVRDGAD